MPRTGPRRPLVAVRLDQADVDALDALAADAQVGRSDVIRAGVELVLRGIDRDRLTAYLADVGKEAQAGALTPERHTGLLG